jgi:hypothetical protein
LSNGSGNFLLAANFRTGSIDVLDRNFRITALAGSFTDPNLPAGFAPHGIHIINSRVYVAYAMQDSAKHDPKPGAGSGVVDVFDENGNFFKRFTFGGKLNAPWGIVATPATFGTFSDAILVGNFGDGAINAFDSTGKFLGQLTDSGHHVIVNPGLWDMVFGAGGTGDPNTLYLTAGGSSQTSGLFATLVPASTVTNADFSLVFSANSATVIRGQSAMLTIGASAVGGFNGPISLSCANPTGVTCSLSPATITPGSSTATSTLRFTAAATPPAGGYGTPGGMAMGWLSLSSVGIFGMALAIPKGGRKRGAKLWKHGLWISGLAVLAVWVPFTVGCGGGSSSTSNHQKASTVTVIVTGRSGSISHSTPITLTIQ